MNQFLCEKCLKYIDLPDGIIMSKGAHAVGVCGSCSENPEVLPESGYNPV